MKEKKVASLKIVFEDGSDYSVACEVGLDKDELAKYIERAFKPEPAEPIFDDEKVSKAIRAWLQIQVQPIEAVSILCSKDSDGFFSYHLYGYIANARIVDGKAVVNKNLLAINFDFRSDTYFKHERGHDYTVAELVGEEEE